MSIGSQLPRVVSTPDSTSDDDDTIINIDVQREVDRVQEVMAAADRSVDRITSMGFTSTNDIINWRLVVRQQNLLDAAEVAMDQNDDAFDQLFDELMSVWEELASLNVTTPDN